MNKQRYYNEITPLTTKIGSKDCANNKHNRVSIKRETMTVEDYTTLSFQTVQEKWMQRINLVWICIYCGKREFTSHTTDQEKQEINSWSQFDIQKRLDLQDRMHHYYGQRLKQEKKLKCSKCGLKAPSQEKLAGHEPTCDGTITINPFPEGLDIMDID